MEDLFDQVEEADLNVAATGTSTTLYKRDSANKVRIWTISVEDFGDKARILVSAGLLDGKAVDQEKFVTKGKNAGRANATTYMQQALADARSTAAKQMKDGYVADIDALNESGISGSGSRKPMLAKVYDPNKKQSGSKNLKGWKLEGVEVGVQCKFDGVRRITFVSQSGVEMYTRSGDRTSTLPHIEAELLESYLRLCKTYPELEQTGIWLDGEAYSHEISFNMINGITRKGATTVKEHEARMFIKYFVYDVMSDLGYKERAKMIDHFVSPHVIKVETDYVLATPAVLEAEFIKFVEQGYEGAMIRQLDEGYGADRQKQLLKYKAFEDAEFVVVGAVESSIHGRIGSFTMRMDKVSYDRAGKLIDTFEATPIASHSEKDWAWANREQFIGQKVTVNFFGRSEYGVPRFPRAKDLRYANDL